MDNPTCTTTGTSTTTASTTPSRTRRPATGRARPRAAAGSDRGNPRPGAPPARRPSHATPGRAARCRGYRRGRPGPPRPGVVLRWDRQERRQVRVGYEQVGQVLRAGCADHRRAPSIRGHPDKLGTTVGAWLHGEPADHEPVRVATHPGEAAERFGLCVVGLDPPAGQGVRTVAHSQPPDRARPSRSASACGCPGRSTRSANAKLRWRSPTVGATAESSVSRSTVAVSSPASHRYPPSVRIAERLTWFPLRTRAR